MDFKENRFIFKQNIEGVGNIRHSHAPLFTESVYSKRFLEGLEDNEAELSTAEVREKCFQVLGFLEEYQRVSGKTLAGKARENESIQGMESEDDLLALLLAEGEQEKVVDMDFGEGQSARELDSANTEAGSEREYIAKRIRELFSYKQVREFFLTNLREEAEKYNRARPKLKTVAKMEFAQNGALRKMVQVYLESKRTHGKLVQSADDNIAKLETMRKKAETRERSERQSANEQERGFLEVQKILQYKHQIREKGFALTPSRRKFVEKITEHVLAGRKVFLVGSTGTGKTELALYVSDTVSGKHEMVSWHEGTTPRDLFGYRELWTDDKGNTVSGTKAGPVTKAVSKETGGATVIHDEYTAGTTRSQIAAKAFMNAKKGQKIHIPGFNGDVFEVSENFAEIFTGNPKDEKTQAREDMDPAILRMLTGLKIDYMPAGEMKDIILSNLIEDNGVLKLSRAEVEMIQKLANAAELMHMFHNREFAEITNSLGASSHELTSLTQVFGGNIEDARLDKHFLDPGTLFSLFSDFDFTQAKERGIRMYHQGENSVLKESWDKIKNEGFQKHLEERLSAFLDDPKSNILEEKVLMKKILELCGVLTVGNGVRVNLAAHNGMDYILPSEFKKSEEVLEDGDPLGEGGNDGAGEGDSSEVEARLEVLGGNRRLTTEVMMQAMERFSVNGLKIEHDPASMREALAAEASILARPEMAELIAKAEKIKTNTEGQESAIIQSPWPKKIMVNGQLVLNNWRTWKKILDERRKTDTSHKPLYNSQYITDEIKDKVWDHEIRVFSGAPLLNSVNRHYNQDQKVNGVMRKNQLAYQKELLGEGFEVQEDLIMAVIMHYVQTGEELFQSRQNKVVRINARDTDGDPAGVNFHSDDLDLGGFDPDPDSSVGVPGAASLGISS